MTYSDTGDLTDKTLPLIKTRKSNLNITYGILKKKFSHNHFFSLPNGKKKSFAS